MFKPIPRLDNFQRFHRLHKASLWDAAWYFLQPWNSDNTTMTPPLSKGRVDVHHHFVPTVYAEALTAAGGDPSGWHIPTWTVTDDLSFSTRAGVQTSILSLTAPGVCIIPDPTASAALAREVNLAAAAIRDDQPAAYGFFAALPSLLDAKRAIAEIDFALTHLKADGVTLFTRYGDDNHYLGHPDFKPIWEYLDMREAVVFVHPTHSIDTHLVNPQLPQPIIDYPHETTRSAVDLIVSGAVRKYASCKIILSHAGGTLPYLAGRVRILAYTPYGKGMTEESFIEDAKSFYFDVALSTSKVSLNALREFARPGHVLFGSDYPYAPERAIFNMTAELDVSYKDEDEVLEQINWRNAVHLFPRLAIP